MRRVSCLHQHPSHFDNESDHSELQKGGDGDDHYDSLPVIFKRGWNSNSDSDSDSDDDGGSCPLYNGCWDSNSRSNGNISDEDKNESFVVAALGGMDLEDLIFFQCTTNKLRINRWDNKQLDWDVYAAQLQHEGSFCNTYLMTLSTCGKLV